jgi:clan AA aspartic protease (TIGR02281 family)
MHWNKRVWGSTLVAVLMATAFGTPALADDVGNVVKQAEAASFFSRIASETSNPYIKQAAQENAARLTSTVVRMSPGRQEIPVITQADSSMAVPAIINSKTMGTFIIDTGSSYTVITPRMAAKLGVQVNADTPTISLITANGVIQAPLVTLNNVTIGQVRVNEVQAVVQDLGKDLMLSGLLGMNFFKGKTITIHNGTLILEDQINNQQLTSR